MANQVIGSFVVNPLLPTQLRPAGQLAFGPAGIPAGFTTFILLFDLRQVNSLTVVFNINIQLSMDGINFASDKGAPLDMSQSGYVLNNGILTRSNIDSLGPGPVRVMGGVFQLPNCDLTTRAIKGTVDSNEAVISGISLAAF